MYTVSYKGSKDISEIIPTRTLTGTLAWNIGEDKVTGTDTLFTSQLRVGQFVVTNTNPSEMFVVSEVVDNLHLVVSRPFAASAGGISARILPIIYALGLKRATQIRGNAVRFPRGHILGIGDGELRLNGQSLSAPLNLSPQPNYAIYDATTGTYSQVGYGILLNSTVPLFSLADGGAGTKNMFAGSYGIRVVARTATGGYSQPSANITVTITTGRKIRITFLALMNVADGQTAYDIYVTQYESATASVGNAILGPHYLYETVTAAQLATENTVASGTVANLYHDFEFADGEIKNSDRILTFDNFPPFDAEFVDLINLTPIFFSCQGKTSAAAPDGTSPGPVVVSGKPDNPEAVMRNKAVSSANGDTILGVVNVSARFWILCENSLQAVILTGIERAPITCRSYWDVGFRNPYNAKFVRDYLFAHSTSGFVRSVAVGDGSSVDFEFSTAVDDYTTLWNTAHVLTGYCPKNKAVCFFFAGYDRTGGYWKTLCLPYLPNQNFWNPPIVLEKAASDFIVSGVATVGQALYFLAGGTKSDGTTEVRTYEFDAPDGVEIECALAWAYSDFGTEEMPSEVAGVASFIGQGRDIKVEIHGVAASGSYDLNALENGHNIALQTIRLGDKTVFGRISDKRQTMNAFSKLTPRLSLKSVNGNARIDELNLILASNSSRK